METRSNNVFVGAVVLILIAITVGAAFWFSRISEGNKREYDIFFKQSVNGLAKGSSVAYSGVYVGQIKDIKLWAKDPDYVRVRILVDDTAPILQGTTATISSSSLTGPNEIQLDGAVRGAPPISCPEEHPETVCPEGAPVIPTKPGALGELLNSAPQLLNRVTTLTERLTELLNDKNQQHFSGLLANLDSLSGSLAARGPEIADTIASARDTLAAATRAADALALAANNANNLINDQGKPLIGDLRATIQSANNSLKTLDAALKQAQPGINQFSNDTMPQVGLLVRDLRKTSHALQEVTDKINQQGVGSLIGSPKLPDYKP